MRYALILLLIMPQWSPRDQSVDTFITIPAGVMMVPVAQRGKSFSSAAQHVFCVKTGLGVQPLSNAQHIPLCVPLPSFRVTNFISCMYFLILPDMIVMYAHITPYLRNSQENVPLSQSCHDCCKISSSSLRQAGSTMQRKTRSVFPQLRINCVVLGGI